MTLLIADGFDHYGTQEKLALQYTMLESDGWTIETEGARTGQAMCFTGFTTRARRTFAASQQIYMGFALKFLTLSANVLGFENNGWVLFLRDSAGTIQASFRFLPDGTAQLWRGDLTFNAGTVIMTLPPFMQPNAYTYIEIGYKVSNSGGVVEIRYDGEQAAIFIGDTQETANANIAAFEFYGNNVFGTPKTWVDDLYVCDDQSTRNNGFLNVAGQQLRMRTLFPVADTDVADWSLGAQPTGWQNLDNVPFNDDDFIDAANVGEASEFTLSQKPTNVTSIAAVIVGGVYSKPLGGDPQIAFGVNSGGVVASGQDLGAGDTPSYFYSQFVLDPLDGTQWKIARVNLLRARVERNA